MLLRNTLRILHTSNRINIINVLQRNYHNINFELLNCYKEVKGDLNVPTKYVIGCEGDHAAWPAKFINNKIGIHVKTIREGVRKAKYSKKQIQQLENLDFIFDYSVYKSHKYILAFKTFKEKYNHGTVPQLFKIKKNDETWPVECRGINLGRILQSIRAGKYATITGQLRNMGIVVDNVYSRSSFDTRFAALKVFKQLNGHVKVPENYVVPNLDSNYHPDAWGLKLGAWIGGIRREGNYAEYKNELVKIGVDFNVKNPYEFKLIYSALNSYKNIHSHVNVPTSFVVPFNDKKFPEDTWGMRLGKCLNQIRIRGYYKEHKQQFVDLGVDFNVRAIKRLDFQYIFSALCSYKKLYGHIYVPHSFIIPYNNAVYPKETWGFKLGRCLYNIRNEGNHKKHHKRLVELGVIGKAVEV